MFSLGSSSSISLLGLNVKTQKRNSICCQMETPTRTTVSTGGIAFKSLEKTFTVDVQRAENRPLNVPLIAPFTIASSRLDIVENVAIRLELSNGCVGWGEAPVLPHVTAEDQAVAMTKAKEACDFLKRTPPMALASVFHEIGLLLPGHQFASVSPLLHVQFLFLFLV